MQQIVEQRILPTQTIVAPEGLNAQQIHGQDLTDDALVGAADGVGGHRLPQHIGMLKQTRVHIFQRGKQRAAVGGAGQNHHHQPAAQNTDDHFTNACLSYLPQFSRVDHVNDRESNDGAGVARQLEGVGDIIAVHRAGPGAKIQPARHREQKEPRVGQRVPGDKQRGAGAQQAARDAAQAFADDAADGGEADHRSGGHGPIRFVKIQPVGEGQRQTHGDRVAQCVAPLRNGGFKPGQCAPRQRGQGHC